MALLFTLRQGDNFVSGFQAQFTGVFALNVTVAFVLLPRFAKSPEVPGSRLALTGSAALLLLPFAMANGLLAGPACAVAALATRAPGGRRVACLALGLTAVSVAVDGSLPSGNAPGAALAFTPSAAQHALAYIGGTVTSGRVPWAVAAGVAGLTSSAAIVLAVVRTGLRSRAEIVAFESVLFTLASAGATAAGRIGAGFGVEQALSGRYATGSAAFWSATLVFWAARLASLPCGRSWRAGTALLTALTVLLLGFVARDQHSYGRTLARQAAAAE